MVEKSDLDIAIADAAPSFVEEAYFSGARLGEAIDWCIARHDRDLHIDVQGKLTASGRDVKFKGRILKVKKGVLSRRIAVLVEEDLRRRRRGDLDMVLTVGGDGATQEDIAATEITLQNYLKRNLSEDLYYDGRDLQHAVKDLLRIKSEKSLCTVWGKRASDKLP
ncbi:MAG: TrmB family transcriptional regulator sugar-binding domain-containing protein, partial [Candidatus Thorarchaeota archaeon]